MSQPYSKVAQLRTADRLLARLAELGTELPCDERILSAAEGSPMALPLTIGNCTAGNRWCIHPMEGWDANRDGSPSDLTLRRWERFGASGAKLIWGGEAAAVVPEGRANPNQTLATRENRAGLQRLLAVLVDTHRRDFGGVSDLIVGLQLTHSGRFCKPNDHKRWEPRIVYHHPLLDPKFRVDPQDQSVVLSDAEVERIIDAYVNAAKMAHEIGFQFVDIKACHGYLLHEFLSARTRPGQFGGDLHGRSRVMRTIIGRIRHECPQLMIGVRISIFDWLPFQQGESCGVPMNWPAGEPYPHGFGNAADRPLEIDLSEPMALVDSLCKLGIVALNVSCGSPYYNPHIQRPAIFPPSDGYLPPEDPLVGVARQIHTAARVKQAFPQLPMVGTGYTYLQDFLPQVAQATVRAGMIDAVGLGRMVLSYPTLPADTLRGETMQRKLVCRTFSECTSAPRNGMVSGCYPLDAYYKNRPENAALQAIKDQSKSNV